MIPPAANPVAGVDQAFLYIIGFSLFFLVFITVLMIYFVIRYRAARHPDPVDIRGNTALEIAWMVIPTLIALSMFYFGWQSYLGLRSVPPGAIDIGVKAEMFLWTFTYPDGKRSRDLLVVPEGTPVKLNISSVDVIHSLSIPAFRVKMDLVPGRYTRTWFQAIWKAAPTSPGNRDWYRARPTCTCRSETRPGLLSRPRSRRASV